MMRLWLNGYISEENIENVASAWTVTPTATDYAIAIRLCKLFGVNEHDSLTDIQNKMQQGLEKIVDGINENYNVSTDAAVEELSTLSLWIPYQEAYAIVSGVDKEHKATIRVEVDITNLLYVDLDLVAR